MIWALYGPGLFVSGFGLTAAANVFAGIPSIDMGGFAGKTGFSCVRGVFDSSSSSSSLFWS
jgi:hypothetical protein